jgi:predicted metal-dependent enzyme (double-stranded beta helix superfamily)
MEKKSFLCIVLMIVLVFMLTSFNVSAQDIAKTNPKYTKVLTDTLEVRIIKVTLAPGEELAMHSHPVYMIYAIQNHNRQDHIDHQNPELNPCCFLIYFLYYQTGF